MHRVNYFHLLEVTRFHITEFEIRCKLQISGLIHLCYTFHVLYWKMETTDFLLASWVQLGHTRWSLNMASSRGRKSRSPISTALCTHTYIMDTLGNNLGWQGWIGVESIDGEYLLARCSHAATMTTVYCTVDIKPGINELCMFHSLQFSTTTCRYNREQKPMIAMYIPFRGLFCISSHLPHWQVSQTREPQDTPARLCPTEKFPTFRAVPLIYGT